MYYPTVHETDIKPRRTSRESIETTFNETQAWKAILLLISKIPRRQPIPTNLFVARFNQRDENYVKRGWVNSAEITRISTVEVEMAR